MKIAKPIVTTISILLVLLVAGLIAVKVLVSPAKIAQEIVPRISALIDREVRIGEASVSLFPPGVQMSGVIIENNAPFEHRPLAKIDHLHANLQLLPLLVGRIKIKEVAIDGWEMVLFKDSLGQNNYDFMPAGTRGDSAQRFEEPLCRHFRLESGRFLYRDDSSGFRMVLGNIGMNYDMRGERLSDIGGELEIDSVLVWSGAGSYLMYPEALAADWRGYYSATRDSVAIRKCEWRVDKFEGRLDGAISTISTSPEVSIRMLSEHTDLSDCEDSRIITAVPFLRDLDLKGQVRIDLAYSGHTGIHSDPGLNGRITVSDFIGVQEEKRIDLRIKSIEANFNQRTLSMYTDGGFIGSSPATFRLTVDDFADPTYSGELALATDCANLAAILDFDPLITYGGAIQANISGFIKPSAPDQGRIFGSITIAGGPISNSTANWSVDTFNCEVFFNGNDATIQNLSFAIGVNQLQSTGSVVGFPSILAPRKVRLRPRFEFALNSDHFDYDTLRFIGKQSTATDTGSFMHAIDWLADCDAIGHIRVKSGRAFGMDFKDLNSRLSVINRIVYCDTMTAKVSSGAVDGEIVYDFNTLLSPEFDFDLRFEDVAAEVLTSRFTNLGDALTGEADLQISIQGRGLSPSDNRLGLRLTGQAKIEDGETKGIEFTRRFEEHFGIEAFQHRRLDDLLFEFQYSDESLRITRFDFGSDDLEYSVTGTLDRAGSVDLLISRKITKDDDRILQSNQEYRQLSSGDRPKWVNFRTAGTLAEPNFSIISVREKD